MASIYLLLNVAACSAVQVRASEKDAEGEVEHGRHTGREQRGQKEKMCCVHPAHRELVCARSTPASPR